MPDRIDSAFDSSFFEEFARAQVMLDDYAKKVSDAAKIQIGLAGDGGVSSVQGLVDAQRKMISTTDELTLSVKAYKEIGDQKALLDAKLAAMGSEEARALTQAALALAEKTRALREAAQAENEAYRLRKDNATLDKMIAQEEKANAKARADAVKQANREKAQADREYQALWKGLLQERDAETKRAAAAANAAHKEEQKITAELANEYGILSKAYQEATLRAKNYALTNNPGAAQAIADAKKLGDQLKALDYAVGQHQRNVGNYSSAFSGLGFSIRNIASELPNLGISIRTFAQSVSNNIGPLSQSIAELRTQNAALAAEGKPTVSIGKQIAASVFSWQTAILALVAAGTALVTYMTSHKKKTEEQTAANKALAESTSAVGKAYGEERSKLDGLKQQIENVNVPMAHRLQAVKDLQELYPDYFKNLSKEAILAGDVGAAYQKTLDALLASARVKAYSDDLTKAIDRMVTLDDRIQAQSTQGGFRKPIQKFASGFYPNDVPFYNPGYATGEKDSKGKDVMTSLFSDIKEYNSALNDYVTLLDKINKIRPQASTVAKIDKPASTKAADAKAAREEAARIKQIFLDQEAELERQAAYDKSMASDESKTLDERLDAYQRYATKSVQAAMARGAAEKKTEKEIKKDITDILIDWQEEDAKLRKKHHDDEVKDTKKKNKDIAELEEAARKHDAEYDKRAKKDKAQRQRELIQEIQAYWGAVEEIFTIERNASNARIAAIDKEIAAIERKKNADIDAVNKSLLSQEEKDRKIGEINARAQAREDAQNAKIRAEKRKQAEIDKALGIAKIILNTAIAVTSQLSIPGAGIGLAIAVGVLGAAQLAAAIATPIPEFNVGTEDSPEGIAKVHKDELVMPKKGRPFVADRDMLTYLNKGSVVKTVAETADIFKYYALMMPELRTGHSSREYPIDEIMDQHADKVVAAIERKKFPSQNSAKPAWWQDYKYQYNR